MDEKTVEVSMELIAISGQAKSEALRALKLAKEGKIEEARKWSKQSIDTLHTAHKVHAEIISGEAQGKEWDIKTLFIHSQDHFTAALVITDLVEHIINLYEKSN